MQLILFPGFSKCTVWPWIDEVRVTVIALPVRLFCVGQQCVLWRCLSKPSHYYHHVMLHCKDLLLADLTFSLSELVYFGMLCCNRLNSVGVIFFSELVYFGMFDCKDFRWVSVTFFWASVLWNASVYWDFYLFINLCVCVCVSGPLILDGSLSSQLLARRS